MLVTILLVAVVNAAHKAIEQNDVKTIREICRDNPHHINSQAYPSRLTPLMLINEDTKLETINEALDSAFVNLSLCDDSGKNVLHHLAGKRVLSFDVFATVFSAALPNEVEHVLKDKDKAGKTPLDYASSNGHERVAQMIKSILDAKEAEETKSNTEDLFKAIAAGKHTEVKTLLAKHIDVYATVDIGRTALHLAAAMGQADIIELLAEDGRYNLNGIDLMLRTPLFYAVRSGKTEAVGALFKRDRKPLANRLLWNKQSDDSLPKSQRTFHTPLHFAVAKDKPEMVRLLRSLGADVNVNSRLLQLTPPMLISSSTSVETVKAVLPGVDFCIQMLARGDTMLHYILGEKKINDTTVALIIDAIPAEQVERVFEIRNSSGLTPGKLAAKRGHTEAAKLIQAKTMFLKKQDSGIGSEPEAFSSSSDARLECDGGLCSIDLAGKDLVTDPQ